MLGHRPAFYGGCGHPAPDIASLIVAAFRLFIFPMWVLINVPTWVDVGRDGIAWRWLYVRRFASMAALVPQRDPHTNHPVLTLSLPGSETVGFIFRREHADAPRHIADVWSASRDAAKVAVDPVDALKRERAEPVEAWIARLRAVSASAGTYRGIPTDRLWDVAGDNAASPGARCGALLVLVSTDDARQRARVLAARNAAPRRQCARCWRRSRTARP